MKQIWDRIHAWLAANAPAVQASLRPGASEEQLREAETALGVSFPEDVRQAYRMHDGTEDFGFLGGWEWLSLQRIVEEWRVWKELLDGGDLAGTTSKPDPGVRNDWYHPAWIPLTYDGGGNHHCLDLAPADGGQVGQIIEMWHDDDTRRLLAPSFGAWLTAFADALEQGNYQVTEHGLERV